MMLRSQFSQLMAPGVNHNFVEWLDTFQKEEEYSRVFNIKDSKQYFEDAVQYVGLGPMPEKTEGDGVYYTDAIQAGTKRVIHLAYALGCRISWELYDDDQYGIIKQVPKALARSARFSKEMVAWNIFNNGFTTVLTTDGVSLFNNQHPLVGGIAATNTGPGLAGVIGAAGTYPNRPAVDADISITALQTMVFQFERVVDNQGLPIAMRPTQLIIPPELKFTTRELLGSGGKPGVSTNEINAMVGEDLTYMVGHYLTSGSAWYAVAPKQNHQLYFYMRQDIDADYDDDFDTRSLKFATFGRWSSTAIHWLGVWGSNGP